MNRRDQVLCEIGYGFDIAVGLRNACKSGRCIVDMLDKPCPFRKDVACSEVELDDWLDVFRDALEDGTA